MSDHDFEKQVQHKMDQLRLRPSDAVWTTVDKRIRKERRRRRVVLWLPLALLCFVAGGYLFYDTSSNNNKITASELNSTQPNSDKNTSESTNPTAGSSEIKSVDQPVIIPGSTVKETSPEIHPSVSAENKNDPSAIQPSPSSVNDNKKVVPENIASSISRTSVQPEKGIAVVPGRKHTGSAPPKKLPVPGDVVGTQGNKPPRKTTGKSSLVTGNEMKKPAANAVVKVNDADPASQPVVTDSAMVAISEHPHQEPADSSGVTAPAPLKIDLAQAPAPKSKKKPVPEAPKPVRKPSSWSFGIVAEGGASHISKGSPFSLLSKENNEPEDLALAAPAPPSQNLYGGPAGFTQFPDTKPAELKSGIAWSAGGFVQKKMNKRISLSAGVQYSYYSMKTDVGVFITSAISVSNANYDQVVSNYYQGRSALNIGGGFAITSFPRPPEQQQYTNKYHFLEFPVKIHWRVTNDEARLPVIVDGGLSVAKLLSSNALHYDGTNDVYYKDYDYFNKLQAGISAGVNVELFSESKHPVQIGPTIRYQLSNLITSDLSSGQHLWSFGLGAKFFLRK